MSEFYKEAGVTYSHKRIRFMHEFVYSWYHLPTKQIGINTVWVYNKKDIITLLNHWSRGERWKYWVNSDEGI